MRFLTSICTLICTQTMIGLCGKGLVAPWVAGLVIGLAASCCVLTWILSALTGEEE